MRTELSSLILNSATPSSARWPNVDRPSSSTKMSCASVSAKNTENTKRRHAQTFLKCWRRIVSTWLTWPSTSNSRRRCWPTSDSNSVTKKTERNYSKISLIALVTMIGNSAANNPNRRTKPSLKSWERRKSAQTCATRLFWIKKRRKARFPRGVKLRN